MAAVIIYRTGNIMATPTLTLEKLVAQTAALDLDDLLKVYLAVDESLPSDESTSQLQPSPVSWDEFRQQLSREFGLNYPNI